MIEKALNGLMEFAQLGLLASIGSIAKFAFASQVSAGVGSTAAGFGGYDSSGVMNSAITMDQYNLLYNGGAGLNYAG